MHLIDRLLFRSYIKSYVFCFTILLMLYVIVDLFTNLDDFTEQDTKLWPVLKHIGTYYGYWVYLIYDRLSEAIVVLAATFTVALMQRNNEMLPLLSAGVSMRRIVLPVLLAASGMLGVTAFNQEVIIPSIGEKLTRQKGDIDGHKDMLVQGGFDTNGVHLDARVASRKEQVVRHCSITVPDSFAGRRLDMTAKEAYFIPKQEGKERTGGWLLVGAEPERLDNWDHPVLELVDPGKYFLYTKSLDFDSMTRKKNWYMFVDTLTLREELSRPDGTRLAAMAVLFHSRLTRPILGFILVLMCLAIILRDQNRNIFIGAGMCLAVCGLFFAVKFACQSLGDSEILSPALAAWLPVLFFGPVSFVMFDSVHT